jgi:glycosyltransferase involved in cell wall biosynthesis
LVEARFETEVIGLASISLALVTYNQAAFLRRFLENYRNYGLNHVELIIIDDGSTDETTEILAALTHIKSIHCHRIIHGSIAKARNYALEHCASPWLAFSDTDCILDRKYFETLPTLPSQFPYAIALEGAVWPPLGHRPPFSHSLANSFGGMYVTANMVFQVPEIRKLGGFDEAFKNYREDSDLALSILEKVGPIPFLPELTVVHPYIPRKFFESMRTALMRQSGIISSEIRLFEKHSQTYALIRHYRDAHSTLKSWCLKHSLRSLKYVSSYLFLTPDLSLSQKISGITPSIKEVIISVIEQGCVAILCMLQWKKIKRLNSK